MTDNTDLSKLTFKDLNVCDELVEACEKLGYKHPTKIQAESIPFSINGRDIIGLAETGSGKTAAFAIPIIQTLLKDPQPFFACVMAPTRELCIQISEQFEALGAGVGLKTAVLVGGLDMVQQAVALSKKPHIVIGTPGRLADHLSNTKGFSLKYLKYLVFDEADRLLNLDFEKQITQILSVIPKKRNTFLFSATMTSKVQKLERASLNDPVKIEVSSKYQTVETLIQNYVFIPAKYKDCYMVYLLTEFSGNKMIVFSTTCANSARLTLILRNLGFKAVGINGQMSQNQRISALNKFKANERNILIATDVAARGLDIPLVDLVINFDLPQNPKNYVHRVGRTARAGKAGRSVSFVTQYDVENFQKIEHLIALKMDAYPLSEENVLVLHDRVVEAQRLANMEMKNKDRGKKGLVGVDDEEEGAENGGGKLLNKRKANFDSKSFARKKKKVN